MEISIQKRHDLSTRVTFIEEPSITATSSSSTSLNTGHKSKPDYMDEILDVENDQDWIQSKATYPSLHTSFGVPTSTLSIKDPNTIDNNHNSINNNHNTQSINNGRMGNDNRQEREKRLRAEIERKVNEMKRLQEELALLDDNDNDNGDGADDGDGDINRNRDGDNNGNNDGDMNRNGDTNRNGTWDNDGMGFNEGSFQEKHGKDLTTNNNFRNSNNPIFKNNSAVKNILSPIIETQDNNTYSASQNTGAAIDTLLNLGNCNNNNSNINNINNNNVNIDTSTTDSVMISDSNINYPVSLGSDVVPPTRRYHTLQPWVDPHLSRVESINELAGRNDRWYFGHNI